MKEFEEAFEKAFVEDYRAEHGWDPQKHELDFAVTLGLIYEKVRRRLMTVDDAVERARAVHEAYQRAEAAS